MADRFIPVLFNLLESILDDNLIFEIRFRQNESFYESIITTLRRAHIPRVTGYAEEVVPCFNEKDFLEHFRITRGMFEEIFPAVADEITSKNPGGHEEIDPAKQLLIFLTYLSNQESMSELSQYFGVGQSTVHGIIKRVNKAIVTRFSEVIGWPDVGTRQRITQDFQLRTTMPNTVGVLDGSHIRLAACPQGDTDYINRKSFPSVQLQVVADNQLLIRDACVGWPGCTHDARVLRNASLYTKAEAGLLMNHDEIIIADSAYPLKQWLITPFRDNGRLGPQHRRFNRILSSARQVVERCFGHLKGRFRRLREITVHDIEDIVTTITSGCILHNLCILHEDELADFFDRDEDGHPNRFQNLYRNADQGAARRQQIMQMLCA